MHSVLRSSELRNNVLYAGLYEHEVIWSDHGKDTNLFVPSETMNGVSIDNVLRFAENRLHRKPLNYNVEVVLSSMQFSLPSHTDFGAMQDEHSSRIHIIAHNGGPTDNVPRERISRFFQQHIYGSGIFQQRLVGFIRNAKHSQVPCATS